MAKYYRVNLKDKMGNIIYPNINNVTYFGSTGNMHFGHKQNAIYGVESDGTKYAMIGHNGTNLWIGAGATTDVHHTGGTFISAGDKENISVSKLVNDSRTNYVILDEHNCGNYALKLSGGVLTGHLYLNGVSSSTTSSTANIVFGNKTTQYVVMRANTNSSLVIGNSMTDNTNAICYAPAETTFRPAGSSQLSLGTSSYRWTTVYASGGNFSSQIAAGSTGAYRIAMGGGDSYAWIDCRDSSNTMKSNMTLTPNRINLYKNTYIGGTLLLTDNISIEKHGSTQVPFKVYGGDANGQGISIGAGAATIVGSGESAKTAEGVLAATTETLWLLSDNEIQFTTNCQTWDSRGSVYLNANRYFYPATTNVGSLGTSDYYWATSYIKKMHGQLEKVSSFFNAGYAGLSYYDGEAMSTSASNDGWAAPSTQWYQILHLDLSVDNYYNDLYFPVNSSECLYWRQRRSGSYYGFMSIPASANSSVKNFRAGAIATWNSDYSGYTNGTVMFCW